MTTIEKNVKNATFTALSPIYYVSRLLGIAPYYMDKTKKFKTSSNSYNIWFIPLQGIIFVSTCYYLVVFINFMKTVSVFAYLGMTVYSLTTIIQIIYIVITNSVLKNKRVRLLNELERNRRNLEKIGIIVDFNDIKKYFLFYIIILNVFVFADFSFILIWHYGDYKNLLLTIHVAIVNDIFYVIPTVEIIQVSSCIRLYGECINGINEYLKTFLRNNNYINLKKTLNSYIETYKNLINFNDSISSLIVINFTTNFTLIVLEIYSSILPVMKHNLNPLIILQIFIIFLSGLGVIFCLSAYEYCKIKLNATKSVVFNLMLNVNDVRMKEELNGFTLAMVHFKPELSALLFNLDFRMITTLCGAINTYTLLLIQSDYNVDVYSIYRNQSNS
ncbi:putative gustatory receptor 28b [Onthophagus taurus]|uniref:putative gustatory receptor 28b n=1 Tax=Onthophagus taurus TaxID=166361 RepID=UPI0039BE59D6